jgi:hypothetical protein
VSLVALKPEDIARLHADAHPGYELASFGEIGLPFFELRFQAHVLAHKPVNPFSEFVLRAAAAELGTDEMSALLGLDGRVLETTLVSLIERDLLALAADGDVVHITEAGKAVLDEAIEIRPVAMQVRAVFDPMLGDVLEPYGDFMAPRELADRGIREISLPALLRPELHQIDVREVERVVRQMGGGREQTSDILALRSMRRFRVYRPAIALVFAAVGGKDVTVEVAIDGQISDRHSEALMGLGIKAKLGIRETGFQPAPITPDDDLSPELAQIVADEAPRVKLREFQRVVREQQNAETVAGAATAEETEDLRRRAQAAEEVLAKAEIRPVETFDHPGYLKDALKSSQHQLIIVSPWLRAAVVDEEFLGLLEEALERGVSVHIGWGISKDETAERNADPSVLRALADLAKRYPNLNVRRLGSTHAKILISDTRYLIVTSFNWLSFRGDPKRTYRDEHGTLVATESYVDAEAERWVNRLTAR